MNNKDMMKICLLVSASFDIMWLILKAIDAVGNLDF